MTEQASAQSRRWIEAVKILDADPNAAVPCPNCGQGTLEVIDAHVDAATIDRYLQCPLCHAQNVAMIRNNIDRSK
jgi:Zn finger protein HypA/HybF involved in hydrogenase expression